MAAETPCNRPGSEIALYLLSFGLNKELGQYRNGYGPDESALDHASGFKRLPSRTSKVDPDVFTVVARTREMFSSIMKVHDRMCDPKSPHSVSYWSDTAEQKEGRGWPESAQHS